MQIPQAKWRAMMESATGATFPVPLWSTRLDQLYTAAWKSHNRALDMVRPPGPPVPQPCPRHGAAPWFPCTYTAPTTWCGPLVPLYLYRAHDMVRPPGPPVPLPASLSILLSILVYTHSSHAC
eukprot:1177371-Prorocentrum_minimum.AAC.1